MPIINTQVKGQGGVQPSGTITIPNNGTYDVTNYAVANVQVPSTAPNYYIQKQNAGGVLMSYNSAPIINFTGITRIWEWCLPFAFYQNNFSGALDMSDVQQIGAYGCYKAFQSSSITSVDLSSLTTVSNNSCQQMFYGCTNLTSADLSGFINISDTDSCSSMFANCTSLTSVDLGSLTTISGGCKEMFSYCSGLTNVDLSSLVTVSGSCYYMFYNCAYLTSIDLSSLTIISGTCRQMFESCRRLESVDLSSLTSISGASGLMLAFNSAHLSFISLNSLKYIASQGLQSAFVNNYGIKISFPALTSSSFAKTNIFSQMLSNSADAIIHFPKNLDPQSGSTAISSLSGYPTFGGTNATLLFDLPSTNHLIGADTIEYERNPKYDTQTALAWRVNGTAVNTTTYYTSTTNDPQVGDTIYSDSACTTAVTTISSIS